ncbi:hypothetical protein EYF80_062695 [Liparis tanakae]|uniref:Uncharacterized protein n=1 Tax=Liparis tanakae TaxID=230148 RepID=A0A4Z2EEN6_9TELE|nr:hypothetical protein EYF80_062695 [Liparis tanakae]
MTSSWSERQEVAAEERREGDREPAERRRRKEGRRQGASREEEKGGKETGSQQRGGEERREGDREGDREPAQMTGGGESVHLVSRMTRIARADKKMYVNHFKSSMAKQESSEET